jgi:pimeloyl-ACP methyl ester carboxylesterase
MRRLRRATCSSSGWEFRRDGFLLGPTRRWAIVFPRAREGHAHLRLRSRGLGRSDPAPQPRTSLDVARDLHALLEAAGIRPAVPAGRQSFGGMNARTFASLYPGSVAGMVLVDSSHPDLYPEVAKVLPPPHRASRSPSRDGERGRTFPSRGNGWT